MYTCYIHKYIIHTHTHMQSYAHMYVCTLNASQLHLHLLIRKKFIFFKKCNPVPPCKQENDTMMTLMGTLYVCVFVCIFITHTHKHTDTIHKRTAAAHVSQYIQRHSHTHTRTYKYIIVAHTLAQTSLLRGTHSH